MVDALSPIDVVVSIAAVVAGMAGSIGRASGVIAEMECCLPMNAAAAILDDFYNN